MAEKLTASTIARVAMVSEMENVMVADAAITTSGRGSGYIAVPAVFTIQLHKNGITAFTINAWLQGIANV
ncbi:hypothetical protein E2562_026603 [Oryza meyeriana var. granulata]|uniref:Uncharacterized protein n=1 Tax=Oryza meyeriana var. granulata TaxID=110450 RepID=A0A6G1CTA2_9ORYZ|nr:hypothetical protein E2562_026603 [Oryza meyeriana var. granulata]